MTLKITVYPATLDAQYKQQLQLLQENNVLERLWNHDHTLWNPNPDEISNRLDWLHLYESMQAALNELTAVTDELIDHGFDTAVLLGMGGSSLAPEVFAKIFGNNPGFLRLIVLDTTDPMAIRSIQDQIDLSTTVFIVATKSGGTVETLSLFKYFYNQVSALPEVHDPGSHFLAITDPGSKLKQLAQDLNFRKTFLNNPNLGGRYSALSFFGLVPAALIGCQLDGLLDSAAEAASINNPNNSPLESPAAHIGALLAAGFFAGKDKLTFISDQTMASFSDWVEQLIAESTGKSGKGILPVVGEPLPEQLETYSKDRIFVLQQVIGNDNLESISKQLNDLDYPRIDTSIENNYDLGSLILTWEIATAVTGHLIGIHPFNQPDVESAKVRARESVQAYEQEGTLPTWDTADLAPDTLTSFLAEIKLGDYIGLQAYLPPSPEVERAFRLMQAKLRDRYKVAVTFGFGPRFLHSTGQMHKGDSGNGHFIQFVSTTTEDLDIPDAAGQSDSSISFSTLKQAQAIGDGRALTDKHRPLLVFTGDDGFLPQLEEFVDSL